MTEFGILGVLFLFLQYWELNPTPWTLLYTLSNITSVASNSFPWARVGHFLSTVLSANHKVKPMQEHGLVASRLALLNYFHWLFTKTSDFIFHGLIYFAVRYLGLWCPCWCSERHVSSDKRELQYLDRSLIWFRFVLMHYTELTLESIVFMLEFSLSKLFHEERTVELYLIFKSLVWLDQAPS